MIGSRIIELDRTASTNDYAAQWSVKGGFEDGTVIWAHEQYAGRGQDHNQWLSESGKNLTLTVCLRPSFLRPEEQFLLNKSVALGVLDFLRHYVRYPSDTREGDGLTTSDPRIKWPNDLYIGRQKIGGILIESRIMGSEITEVFAGIGVNINQTRFAPDVPNPVSLIHILRHEVVLREALANLCQSLENRYRALRAADPKEISAEYDRSLLGYGEPMDFLRDGESFRAEVRGVDDHGRLILAGDQGEPVYFSHKEIGFVLS